jgi:predicted nuclease of predicted toxin-antitoxin system
MKLLVDMNLPPAWVPYLAGQGFEAVHWSSVGIPDALDSVIVEYAIANQLVVFTHDLDFGAILAHTRSHRPSVIQARVEDITPEAVGPSLIAVLRQFEAEINNGAIVTIQPDRTKVRVLPI